MNEHTQAYMVKAVRKFLDGEYDGDKWNYEVHDEVAFSGQLAGAGWKIDKLKYFIIVRDDCVSCYHIVPINVPAERRSAVSEYITRANYGLAKGNFELDFNDGELRYKMTISQHDLLCDDNAVCQNMNQLLLLGPAMWRRYGDNLLALLFDFANDKSIEELVRLSENND